jgi:hypothetical protein
MVSKEQTIMPKSKDLRLHGISFDEALRRLASPVPAGKKSTQKKPAKNKRGKRI